MIKQRERIEDEFTRIEAGDAERFRELLGLWRANERLQEAYAQVIHDLREHHDVLEELDGRVEA